MNISRLLRLGVLVAIPLNAIAGVMGAEASEPVAIIYLLDGEASVAASDAARRPLRLFDRLPAGAALEVGPGSHLALAFASGQRYELGALSQVKLGTKDLAHRAGHVRSLSPVRPLLSLFPIAENDHPGPRHAAPRIRSERIMGLYPRHGTAVLAKEAVLDFQPVEGARAYRIEVQDDQGGAVFQIDIETPPVKLPAGTLRAGLRYQWTVCTLDRPVAVARGEAELVTLSENDAREREKARKILETETPDSLPLLAEIDRSLGLLVEARKELREALDRKPGDPGLRQALAEIETRLEEENDPQ
jgi:hypothetical protein